MADTRTCGAGVYLYVLCRNKSALACIGHSHSSRSAVSCYSFSKRSGKVGFYQYCAHMGDRRFLGRICRQFSAHRRTWRCNGSHRHNQRRANTRSYGIPAYPRYYEHGGDNRGNSRRGRNISDNGFSRYNCRTALTAVSVTEDRLAPAYDLRSFCGIFHSRTVCGSSVSYTQNSA